jgi:hypothetical protein
MSGTIDRQRRRPRGAGGALLAISAALLAGFWPGAASAAPIPTRIVHATGRIVPIPASVPHESGDMVDRRIVGDLRWIAARYPIYVTDGYSGPLPDGAHVGCDGCHVKGSDHYNGLAVDIVPLGGSSKCDASWAPITRLAEWAEPVQNQPRPPFRWVGYEGDAGHGCGNHLHLSWEHAPAPMFQLAEWVEVFPTGDQEAATQTAPEGPVHPSPPAGPLGGARAESVPPKGGSRPSPTPAKGPQGGISTVQSGGIGAGD